MTGVAPIPADVVRRAALSGLLALLLLVAAAAAIAARRPDVLARPQFWAEDGMEWFARAYNWRLWYRSVLLPYGAYLQTFPRLVALAARAAGLAAAPLVFALLALAVQAVAPVFLLSDRLETAVPGRARRLLIGALLIAMPNAMEVHVNVTNSQVHLALLALLVLLARPSASRGWRTFDVVALLVSGLSGPFVVLLAPIAVLCWWHARDRWSRTRLLVVLTTALIQLAVLLPLAARSRQPRSPHGATIENLLDLLGGQVVTGGLAGQSTYLELTRTLFASHPWLAPAIGAAGLVFVVRAAWITRSFALRVLLAFAALHLAAALASPIIIGPEPLWVMLQTPTAGQRYWFFAILAFLATVLWTAAADPRPVARVLGATLLGVLLLVGVPRDWWMPPRPDLDFPTQVERFAHAAPRERVTFEILPQGWQMVLIRKR